MSVQGNPNPNNFSSFYRHEAPGRAGIPSRTPDSPGSLKKTQLCHPPLLNSLCGLPPAVFRWVDKMGIEINKIKQ
jgi:hypothetical protein